MDTKPTISEAAAMLVRLSADDVERRLVDVQAEEKSLRTLLRSIRAREVATRRKAVSK